MILIRASMTKHKIHFHFVNDQGSTVIISYRAVGALAELLNKSADAETFHNRSKNYKNVWNKERELMCPRSKSGEFHCPLDPTLNTWIVKYDGFTEGEHEQYL